MIIVEQLGLPVPVHMELNDWEKMMVEVDKLYRHRARVMDAVDEAVYLFLDEEE